MEKVRYMISDAANIVHVESHVLRYWEDELELNIPRNEMGHRYYTKENIAEFQRIKELKEQGYQLKAIRMIVHNGPIEGLTAEAPIPAGQAPLSAGAAAAIPQPVQPVAAQPAAVAQPVQQSMQQSVQPVQPAAPQQLPVKTTAESPQSILNNTDKMAQFTELMTEIVGKALAANNEELGQSISEEVGKQVIKEMNYLMREREEAEENRFRRLDAAIRGNIRKKDEQKEKKLWKKKKPSQA